MEISGLLGPCATSDQLAVGKAGQVAVGPKVCGAAIPVTRTYPSEVFHLGCQYPERIFWQISTELS